MNEYDELQKQNKNWAQNMNNCLPDYIDADNFSEQMTDDKRSIHERSINLENVVMKIQWSPHTTFLMKEIYHVFVIVWRERLELLLQNFLVPGNVLAIISTSKTYFVRLLWFKWRMKRNPILKKYCVENYTNFTIIVSNMLQWEVSAVKGI